MGSTNSSAPRRSGLLLHASSLPGRFGIGDLGPAAHAWVDRLADSKQAWWQVLPLGPTGYGDSPYQCFSAFAGNPTLISPESLVADGLLQQSDIANVEFPGDGVDYERVIEFKSRLTESAWADFRATADFEDYCQRQSEWLDDFALFMAIKGTQGGRSWQEWPDRLRLRDYVAIRDAQLELANEIGLHKFRQFLFAQQWLDLRDRAKRRRVRFIGDMPIFVALDSADVWANPHLFLLDHDRRPKVQAGVPPDYFSATGQLWGNPLYDWDEHETNRYAWWKARLGAALRQVDLVRLDHFRGFEAAWHVPAGATTAQNGRWVEGPGVKLFEAVRKELGSLQLIAEDLGVITPEVDALRHELGLPGMRIAQFAFGGATEERFLPHNYEPHAVVYTGTHDNNTTVGWHAELAPEEQRYFRRYVPDSGEGPHWDLTRLAWASVAELAVAPLQDLLGLGAEARMNMPGRPSGNWRWRATEAQIDGADWEKLATLTETYQRRSFSGKPKAPATVACPNAGAFGLPLNGRARGESPMLQDDPLWYKDAIIYELHVRAFHDSDGDGIGDFKGLTQKLDYLQDLGITAIWLLPFYPSPLKDDGYDIADYTEINPSYGTLADFKEFLDAAHARGLRVITELVINHTSDQHPWFQRARRSPPGSVERDFYVWSESPEKYKEARIIFKDFEPSNWTWDHVAKTYYWHRFYSHQPDLNFDNKAVWDAIFPAMDFWMEMGVDGMRLDAVPYLFEREGTNCENLPETHGFLKALRKHADEKFPGRCFLSEANQWPEDAVAYFGDGDETHLAFHFPVMPRLFMSIHMEDRFPIIDIMDQTPAIPDNCQWCMFLRNHDELTLEMVTDEERDYMYRAYANDPRARINLGIRHRLAPLLGANRRRIELMNALLFSLPGTPVLYYGDEIGMGDNIYLGDRNGVRTPMQWSADRNAGFSRANPQRLFLPIIIDPEYHYEAINVDAQQNNSNSLLWWMKWLITLRKRHKAFGRGSIEFLHPANRKVLAFLRSHPPPLPPAAPDGGETILVVANLSRFVQHVEIDLNRFQGSTPIELFGHNAFPIVGKERYPLTLAPHGFLWFVLQQPVAAARPAGERPEDRYPALFAPTDWEEIFRNPALEQLEEALPKYLYGCRWAGGGGRVIKSATVRDSFRLRYRESVAFVCLVDVEYREGAPERYFIPIALAQGDAAKQMFEQYPSAIVAVLRGRGDGLLFDALATPELASAIVEAMAARKTFALAGGEVRAVMLPAFTQARPNPDEPLPAGSAGREEQTHTSVIFGDKLILKVFRRIEAGTHPEVEVGRYLTEKREFGNVAPILGVIEFRSRRQEPTTLAVLHGYVPNEGTAWQYTLDELSRFFERVLALPAEQQAIPVAFGSLLDLADAEVPPAVQELMGRYLESARLLGERTAKLHLALAAEHDNPAFAPEPFNYLYQRSQYQSMRTSYLRTLDLLRQQLPNLPEPLHAEAQRLLAAEPELSKRFRQMLARKFVAQRTRVHGDFNLAEILYTGKDFFIIDFEGHPSRSLADRRVKRSPLRDVASMLRSFHYGANGALLEVGTARGRAPGVVRPEDVPILEPWAWTWYRWVAAGFLKSYLALARGGEFLPTGRDDLDLLLELFTLDKAMWELSHELRYPHSSPSIPMKGILQTLDAPPAAGVS